jgi:hypothetical protein
MLAAQRGDGALAGERGQPEVDSWVAAVYASSTGGAPLGSGVVIDERRVLTCAHVVPAGDGEIWVAFPTRDPALAVAHADGMLFAGTITGVVAIRLNPEFLRVEEGRELNGSH